MHRESKKQAVYALVPGKGALNESRWKDGTFTPDAPGGRTRHTPYGEAHLGISGSWQIREGPFGPIRIGIGEQATTHVVFLKVTMAQLAEALTPSLAAAVVDATGRSGTYQVEIEWTVPPPPPSATGLPVPAPQPVLSVASVERAGLKLQKRKAAVDVIVVDRLEKAPAGN